MPVLPGLDEAVREALRALVAGSLTTLNARLARDAATPMLFASGQVVLGDSVHLTASRISIVGGGEADGRDMLVERHLAPNIYRVDVSTNLYVYLHPDEMTSDSPAPEAHMARIELALSRVCDHLRPLLNAGSTLTLGSREYAAAPAYDVLMDCHVREIAKGVVPKSHGQSLEVPSAHLVWIG